MTTPTTARYIGRLAPSPTGLLHLGHARTFWIAASRARAAGGRLLLRNDDLDRARCRPEFVAAMIEDLRWLLGDDAWEEPMISQSERLPLYREALARLHAARLIFPCRRSRRDVAEAIGAPHEGAHDEPLYPREWRPPADAPLPPLDTQGLKTNWRFRVPDPDGNADNDARISFVDGHAGPQQAVAGRDFGDFLVWRKDGLPSYQLACAVDDLALGVTEVVRGADLIRSTFRQLLLMRALAPRDTSPPPPSPALPRYYHCPLMTDETGQRLAKRHDALALRTLRADGTTPDELRHRYFDE
ncbi:glutamyl-Q tRNA(Asp) synthetase [Geminisphaera colitermitum]|uniref:glutamyl-Q tRNA(Asp) synthetase n=1 Tax=Geminisphaera colitermitum TaxID=1148786 RepID=UPI00019651AA|nr:glutamyl-Q tRNA(Asp) synthetase [Geminisphaera colitermitum]